MRLLPLLRFSFIRFAAFLPFLATAIAQTPPANVGLIRNGPILREGASVPTAYDFDTAPAPAPSAYTLNLNAIYATPVATGQYAKISSTFGDAYLEFYPSDAPATIANFKSYLATDATTAANLINTFDNVFIHRSVPGFVVQTGGYQLRAPLNLVTLTKKPAVTNEFRAANTRGTIAMAKIGSNPNSATNEWFVNLADNRTILDNQNGGFTAFGRVLGDGMRVFDRIATQPILDVDGSGSTFNETPVRNYSSGALVLSNFIFLTKIREIPAASVPAAIRTPALLHTIIANDNPSAFTLKLSSLGVLTATPSKGGRAILRLRSEIAGGHAIENTLTITRATAPQIIKPLAPVTTAALGSTITLDADITAWPLAIKWQRRTSATSEWQDLVDSAPEAVTRYAGVQTERLTLRLDGANSTELAEATALSASQFRFIVANASTFAAPFIESKPTTLTVTTTLAFASNLAATTTAALGTNVTLSVTPLAGTFPLPSFQWQRLPAGANPTTGWIDLANPVLAVAATETTPAIVSVPSPYSGAQTGTLTIFLNGTTPAAANRISTLDTIALNGSQYRCLLTHNRGAGPVSTPSTATTLSITTDRSFRTKLPATTTAALGTSVLITQQATATTFPAPTYQWQRRANPASGWENLISARAAVTTPTPAPAVLSPYTGTNAVTLSINLAGASTTTGTGLTALETLALQNSEYRCVITNALGSTEGAPTKLRLSTLAVGLAAQPPAAPSAAIGETLELTAGAQAVAINTPLSYRWEYQAPGSRNWLPVVDDVPSTEERPPVPSPYSGASTRTLRINLTGSNPFAPGYGFTLEGTKYRCVLSNLLKDIPAPLGGAKGNATTTISTLRVLSQRLTLITPESFNLPTNGAPNENTTYSATGLPSGLSLNTSSGLITGTPTKPGVYRVVLSTRLNGVVTTVVHYLEVRSLDTALVGSYEALLADGEQPPVGKLTLTIAANGSFTGTLSTLADAKPLSFRGALNRSLSTRELSLAAPIDLPRTGTPTNRIYRFNSLTLTAANRLSVALLSGSSGAALAPYANATDGTRLLTFTATNRAPWGEPVARRYHLSLGAPRLLDLADTRSYPRGAGFATVTPSARGDGSLSLSGKMGDGQPFTATIAPAASTLVPAVTDSAEFRLFARPYNSLNGALLAAQFRIAPTRYNVLSVNGQDAYWGKPAVATTATGVAPYPAGFGPLGLGLRLEPANFSDLLQIGHTNPQGPAADITLNLEGETVSNVGPNARGLPTLLRTTIADTITLADAQAPDASAFTGVLAITPAGTGLTGVYGRISGSFKLQDAGAPERTVTYEALVLPPVSGSATGVVTVEGYALVPSLNPTNPPTTALFQLSRPVPPPTP